jgi:hypothetical protein
MQIIALTANLPLPVHCKGPVTIGALTIKPVKVTLYFPANGGIDIHVTQPHLRLWWNVTSESCSFAKAE